MVLVNTKGKVYYQGAAEWQKIGTAVEKMLGIKTKPVKFTPKGTGFG